MKPGDYTRGRARTDVETLVQMFPELRARAFAVGGIEDFNALRRIQDAVAKVHEGGDWKKLRGEIAAEIGSDGDGTRRRAETILRTNSFQAYGAARWRKQQEMKEVFPYLKYVAMDDGRTRSSHAALDGVILPIDDPFWKDHYPPWDFNCRCIAIQLTAEDAHEEQERGDGSMWSEQERKLWLANHAGMDATRQFHFRPDTMDMDLRDLAKAEGRTPEDMEAFGKLMETRTIGTGETGPDGREQTTTVREWLLRPVRAEYHARARNAVDNEEAWVTQAWTGADVSHVVGTARGVSIGSVPTDGGSKLVFHSHGSGSAMLSPRDVLTATARSDVEALEAVSGRGWMRVRPKVRGEEMRRSLRQWRDRLDAAEGDPDRYAALAAEWRKWLDAQRRYGYFEIDKGGNLA